MNALLQNYRAKQAMNRVFILLIILNIGVSIVSNAQALRLISRKSITLNRKINLDSNSLVKDSTGRVIPYREWSPIVASREYLMKYRMLGDSNHVEYTLYPFTEKQKELRYSQMPKPAESTFFKNGEDISSFSADDINGNGFKLKKLHGKIVVLNFWFIGCPPCRLEIPELNKLALSYADDPDVVFIAFGLDDSYDIKKFIRYSPFNYHIVDNSKPYVDLYRIDLFPTNVVLDKNGKVRFHSTGYADNLAYWIKKTINESK